LDVFSVPHPVQEGRGVWVGHIQHVDHFGDLVTDVTRSLLPSAKLVIDIGGTRIQGLSSSYQEGGELLAVISSGGYLEIAARNGNAAKLLGARVGDSFRVAVSS